jgi:hypothetical protein
MRRNRLVIAKQEFVEARKKFTLRDHRKGVDLQILRKVIMSVMRSGLISK